MSTDGGEEEVQQPFGEIYQEITSVIYFQICLTISIVKQIPYTVTINILKKTTKI